MEKELMNDNNHNNNIKYKDFIEKNRKNLVKKYSAEDIILWLLYSNEKEIFGRISLFKQLFLLWEEVIPFDIKNETIDLKFIPYKYGPYSFFIADVLENMYFNKIINIRGRKNSISETFSLSEKGIFMCNKSIERIKERSKDSFLKELAKKRITWDTLGNRGLLQLVYVKHSEYKENSLIKSKINTNIWDTGRFG